MQRIIYIEVAGNRARASSRELGTQGEVAAVTVALAFDEGWNGLAKRLLWRSASGASTGYTLLSEPDGSGVYTAAVPALPLSEAGKASLTVEGVATSGTEVERRVRSAVIAFRVEPNDLEANSPAQAVDASVAEQLAAAIEGKASASHTHARSDVSDFAHTHTKAEITDFAHTHEFDAGDVVYTEGGSPTTVEEALDALFFAVESEPVGEYTATLSAEDWSGAEAPFTQTVSCAAVSVDSHVLVGVAGYATDAQYEAGCAACLRFLCGSGAIIAKAYGVRPSADVPIKIGVIR